MTTAFNADGFIGAQTTASPLALITILTLVALLITKEITSSLKSGSAKRLNSILNIALVPLLILSIISFIAKLLDVL